MIIKNKIKGRKFMQVFIKNGTFAITANFYTFFLPLLLKIKNLFFKSWNFLLIKAHFSVKEWWQKKSVKVSAYACNDLTNDNYKGTKIKDSCVWLGMVIMCSIKWRAWVITTVYYPGTG